MYACTFTVAGLCLQKSKTLEFVKYAAGLYRCHTGAISRTAHMQWHQGFHPMSASSHLMDSEGSHTQHS